MKPVASMPPIAVGLIICANVAANSGGPEDLIFGAANEHAAGFGMKPPLTVWPMAAKKTGKSCALGQAAGAHAQLQHGVCPADRQSRPPEANVFLGRKRHQHAAAVQHGHGEHGILGRSANPHRLFAIVNIGVCVFGIAFFATVSKLLAAHGIDVVFYVLGGLMVAATLACALWFPAVGAPFTRARRAGPAAAKLGARVFAFAGVAFMTAGQSAMFSFVQQAVHRHRRRLVAAGPSGYGGFGGKAGIDAFTELRWVKMVTESGHFPI